MARRQSTSVASARDSAIQEQRPLLDNDHHDNGTCPHVEENGVAASDDHEELSLARKCLLIVPAMCALSITAVGMCPATAHRIDADIPPRWDIDNDPSRSDQRFVRFLLSLRLGIHLVHDSYDRCSTHRGQAVRYLWPEAPSRLPGDPLHRRYSDVRPGPVVPGLARRTRSQRTWRRRS